MFVPNKNSDRVKALLNMGEGEILDFKLTINDSFKIAKTLVAFANTVGGTIAIGINDQKKVIGIDPSEELFMIEQAANIHCQPAIEFDSEVFEINYIKDEKIDPEVYILLIYIKKSNFQHRVKDKDGKLLLYHRVNDRSLPVNSQK
ncbi:ATP-binding protein [Belliella sp. DSM 111904]|uniref:ATP-binding protein n=1 Tax=Belliella filtrata TaxID=2923435 RepID=A0ABS9V592_9BACT|nr:ATP-binding protein [Belliella filtrata]MCH7411345.1 ATP-binding protein [Belliella filtrata]